MAHGSGQVRHEQEIDRVAGEDGGERIEKIRQRIPGRAAAHLSNFLLLTSLEMLEPSTAVQYVKGIGPRLAEVLAAKGIHTVDDLLHYLPFRYEDRLNPRSVAELRAGEMATVIAEVRNSGLFRTRRMPIFQLTVGQGRNQTGSFSRATKSRCAASSSADGPPDPETSEHISSKPASIR